MANALSSIPPDLWSKFSELLDALLDLDPSEREACVRALEANNPLRPLVEAALRAQIELRDQPTRDLPRLPARSPSTGFAFKAGARVGPYTLVSPLGRGGMGEVWRAERCDGALQREVALKLPHTWLLSVGVRMRLSRERDILAALTHPHIAQLYDAGIGEDGSPWLALEYVKGERIDTYCREKRLSLASRLALFEQVLMAVSAAHARLIVHRDLKPSNIHVTDTGSVKLLDFGIAKLVNEDGVGEASEITELAGRAATPEYAAPEQLSGAAVTVATDVYALGVVLFELLSGKRPFSSRDVHSTERLAPPLVSTAASATHADEMTCPSVRALRRSLEGDLDAILAKALASSPADRYESVERLAEDLKRHRQSHPIEARHITRVERALKFAKRNGTALGVAGLLVTTLSIGAVASLWQARRATREAERAAMEAQRANATRDFLKSVLASNRRTGISDRAAGSSTAREMLDDMVARLETDLHEQPETRLELLMLAADMYRQWVLQAPLERALSLYRACVAANYGRTDARYVDSLLKQAAIYIDYAWPGSPSDLVREAGDLIREGHLEGTKTEARWLTETARLEAPIAGYSTHAIEYFERAAAIYGRIDPKGREQLWLLHFMAMELLEADRVSEAREAALRGIEVERAYVLRPDERRNDWYIGNQLLVVASCERRSGHRDAALVAYEEADRLVLATFGRDSDLHMLATVWRATLRQWAGDTQGALALLSAEKEALHPPLDAAPTADEQEALHPPLDAQPDCEGCAWTQTAYGRAAIAEGRAEEALMFLQLAATVKMTQRPTWFRRADALVVLGEALEALSRTDEARAAFREAANERESDWEVEPESALAARERWARFLLAHGDDVTARAEFDQVLRAAGGRALPAVALAQAGLARAARLQGDRATAKTLVDSALATLNRVVALYDPKLRALVENEAAAIAAPE